MGSFISTIQKLFGSFKRETRITMVGLDAAGKTTLLYKLHLGEHVTTIPTIGFNVEHVDYKNLAMTIWDVGGQSRIRPLWKHYYQNCDAVIFVVDSSDPDRFEEAAEELHATMEDENLKNTLLLVYSNKSDLPTSCPTKDVAKALKLTRLKNKWYIQGCCATSGDGIIEGIEFIVKELNDRK